MEGVRGRGLGAGAVQLAVTEPPAWGESPCEDGNVMGVGGSREPREMGRREQQSGWRSRQRKTGRTGQGAWDGGETTGLWWGARRGGPPRADRQSPPFHSQRSDGARHPVHGAPAASGAVPPPGGHRPFSAFTPGSRSAWSLLRAQGLSFFLCHFHLSSPRVSKNQPHGALAFENRIAL